MAHTSMPVRPWGRRVLALTSIAALVLAAGAAGATAASKSDKNKKENAAPTAAAPTQTPAPILARVKVGRPQVDVQAKDASAFATATDDQAVREGDTVRTDSAGRAEIDFLDGSLMRLGVNTEYQLTKLTAERGGRQTAGKLNVGRTWHRVAAVTETGAYGVTGASATAAVEGTAFVVTCPLVDSCQFTAVVDAISFENGPVLTPGQAVMVSDETFGEVRQLTPDELAADEWIRENLLLDQAAGLGNGLADLDGVPRPPGTRTFILIVEDGVVVNVIEVTPDAPPPPPPPPPPSNQACELPESSPPIVFDGSPGTGAPPATLGTCAMAQFGPDSRALFTDVTSVDAPGGGTIEFSGTASHRRIGQGWATWSHGYTGDVYFVNSQSVTLTLPDDTIAFFFYVEPNSFGIHDFVVTLDDGTTSGVVPVDGASGATYFGFYSTSVLAPIRTITVVAEPSAGGFAIGEFGIARLEGTGEPPSAEESTPAPSGTATEDAPPDGASTADEPEPAADSAPADPAPADPAPADSAGAE